MRTAPIRRRLWGAFLASVGRTLRRSIPHLIIVLALLLYLPWALGVPGTPSADYATGWYVGFYALNFFIATYAILGVLALIARFGQLPVMMYWIEKSLWVSVAAFILFMAGAMASIIIPVLVAG
jgi:hypothetical protein